MSFEDFKKLLREAEIIEYRYPVAGSYIWLPYGVQFRNLYMEKLKKELNKMEYEEYRFPYFVSGHDFKTFSDKIGDFNDNVFWLNENKSTLLYPSGEAIVYPLMSEWIRTHADLPFKLFQIGYFFRPSSVTHVLFKPQEYTTTLEGYGLFSSPKEAKEACKEMRLFYRKFFDEIALPGLFVEMARWHSNPVAITSFSYNTPSVFKKTVKCCGIYYSGNCFSEMYKIYFETMEGNRKNAYTFSFGMSDRVLAGVLDLNKDSKGLRLPSELAPYQVVILPIYSKNKKLVDDYLNKLKTKLSKFRVKIDKSDKRLSKKYNEWVKRGVPILIEAGIENIEQDSLIFIRRADFKKLNFTLEKVLKETENALKENDKILRKQSNKTLKNLISDISSKQELVEFNSKGIIKTNWCGGEKCGKKMEKLTGLEVIGSSVFGKKEGKCTLCQKKTNQIAILSKRYYSP